MKGNGKFWKLENAEAMLTMRGHVKADQFEILMTWWRKNRAQWWTTSDRNKVSMALPFEHRMAA
jgi:hypothetical protein